jgi:hypothetical protein
VASALMPFANIWIAIVISILFIAWFVGTFYMLPLIMEGEKCLLSAIRKSIVAIEKNWRETIIIVLLFDALLFVVSVFVFLFLGILVFSQHSSGYLPFFSPFGISFMAFLIIAFLCLVIFVNAMPAVFRILLYRYSARAEKFIVPSYPYEKILSVLKAKKDVKKPKKPQAVQ